MYVTEPNHSLSDYRARAVVRGLLDRADECGPNETVSDLIRSETSWAETREAASWETAAAVYRLGLKTDEDGYRTVLVGADTVVGPTEVRSALKDALDGIEGRMRRARERAARERAAYEARDEFDGMGWGAWD